MTTTVSQGIGKLIWVMISFLPLYSVGRISWLGRTDVKTAEERRNGQIREIILAVFALFMFGLLMLTFESPALIHVRGNFGNQAAERLRTGLGINLVPFRTIRRFLKFAGRGRIMVNIVGNIVMFLPWGFGLPLLWKKNQAFLNMTIMSLALPACIEFVQLFIGRTVDIDDVILNFAGSMLGWLVYLLLVKAFPELRKLAR